MGGFRDSFLSFLKIWLGDDNLVWRCWCLNKVSERLTLFVILSGGFWLILDCVKLPRAANLKRRQDSFQNKHTPRIYLSVSLNNTSSYQNNWTSWLPVTPKQQISLNPKPNERTGSISYGLVRFKLKNELFHSICYFSSLPPLLL